MGNLLSVRVRASDVFSHVGIEFTGLIRLRPSSGCGRTSFKGYISVFVCLSTKSVHLEVVSGLVTRNFLHAFKRFVSRRGLCSHVYSDCGKNVVGADAELRESLSSGSGVVFHSSYCSSFYPNDLSALTAAHFLISRSILLLPESGHLQENPS